MELFESNSAEAGDFVTLLRRFGALGEDKHLQGHLPAVGGRQPVVETQATTVLAFKFSDGVLIAGDRRATAGNVDRKSVV